MFGYDFSVVRRAQRRRWRAKRRSSAAVLTVSAALFAGLGTVSLAQEVAGATEALGTPLTGGDPGDTVATAAFPQNGSSARTVDVVSAPSLQDDPGAPIDLGLGRDQSCAVFADGVARCWGFTSYQDSWGGWGLGDAC